MARKVCPICGSDKYEEVKGVEMDYYECSSCSVHFSHPDKFLIDEDEIDQYKPDPFSGRMLYGISIPDNKIKI